MPLNEPVVGGPVPHFRVFGTRSYAVVVVYLFLTALLLLVAGRSSVISSPYVTYLLVGVILLFLVRYLSTHYVMDDRCLHARRILGTRNVPFETVRRIEFANLRDLGPVGIFGSWGYRGRMWSPTIGSFDAIYTDSRGLLVTAGTYPLFLSPRDPESFARELSRRVRSYTGPLEVDVGAA
jgi:hypothetical protein